MNTIHSCYYYYCAGTSPVDSWASFKMPSSQILQPVLKMKVDELFLTWLSDLKTQAVLKDYLELIKNGHQTDFSNVGIKEKCTLTFNQNNNVAFQKTLTEKKPGTFNVCLSPPCASPLPSGCSGSSRVMGHHGRILQRSVSSKKVSKLIQHRIIASQTTRQNCHEKYMY